MARPREQGADATPQGTTSLNVAEARKAQTEELLGQLGGRAELPTHAVRRITRTVGYVASGPRVQRRFWKNYAG